MILIMKSGSKQFFKSRRVSVDTRLDPVKTEIVNLGTLKSTALEAERIWTKYSPVRS
jgi:hypothetical protein